MIADETCEASDSDLLVTSPLVSVLMTTYNHAEYLADAIEGVVNQRCPFPFELIIGEDASTDATRQVALDYQKRYPGLIRVVYSDHNVGMIENSRRIFQRGRGKYIAYCEGDDFWCARDKLACQVKLIDARDDIGVVHSDWTKATLHNGTWIFDLRRSVHRRVALRYLQGDLFRTWHFPKILRTCTVLIRRELTQACYASGLSDGGYPFGDSIHNVFATSLYKVAYLPEVASVYRVSPNSALRSGTQMRVRFYEGCLRFDTAARAYFAGWASYQPDYRWEADAGLLAWGLRARDWHAITLAIRDIRKHFTLREFVAGGYRAISMRLPTLRRQHRDVPDVPGTIRAKPIR